VSPHKNGVIQYVAFVDERFNLRVMMLYTPTNAIPKNDPSPQPKITTARNIPPKHTRRKKFFRFLLVIFSVWLIVCLLLTALIVSYGGTSYARDADVIIVLGAGLNRNGAPGRALTRRAEEGARLYAQGYASVVLCTGGIPRNASQSEASGCAAVLRANGVPDSAILLEERSRSTEENAAYSQEIMTARGDQTALVVSDGFHLLRAQWIFKDQGVEAYTVPATTRPLWRDLIMATGRELVALHWQVIKTALGLPYTFVPWV